MKTGKKLYIMVLFVALCFANTGLYAVTVTGVAPQVALANQTAVITAFNNLLDEVRNGDLRHFDNQDDLAQGFADVSTFLTRAASLDGYQDYDLFAISTGAIAGVQLPSFSTSYDYYKNLVEDVSQNGDLYAGFGGTVAWVNLGINAGALMDGLYLNVKVGGFDDDAYDVSYKSRLFGIGANYSFVRTTSVLGGLFTWRGISLGTGFYYHHTEADFVTELDEERVDISGGGSVVVDPDVNLGFDVTTYTIPIDIVTSVRVLWLFNLSAGIGLDLNYGTSDIIISSRSDVDIEGGGIAVDEKGYIRIDGSTKDEHPSLLRSRLMLGAGLNLGPVKLDVPFVYYPTNGYTVGVTAALVY